METGRGESRKTRLRPFLQLTFPRSAFNRTNHVRHFKHAFGENPSRVYGQTRMDTQWDFRNIYNQAQLEKVAQDEWCSSVEAAIEEPAALAGLGRYPQSSLRLEPLVDTLRGKVLVNAHCVSAELDLFGERGQEETTRLTCTLTSRF